MFFDAFDGDPEARLIDWLRADGELSIAFVAEDGGAVVGVIAMSPMRQPSAALALGPIAVAAKFRRQGTGSALIEAAIERARGAGAELVFVLGDTAYYQRFGFSPETAEPFDCAYAGPHFMALQLSPQAPQRGAAVYARAFDDL